MILALSRVRQVISISFIGIALSQRLVYSTFAVTECMTVEPSASRHFGGPTIINNAPGWRPSPSDDPSSMSHPNNAAVNDLRPSYDPGLNGDDPNNKNSKDNDLTNTLPAVNNINNSFPGDFVPNYFYNSLRSVRNARTQWGSLDGKKRLENREWADHKQSTRFCTECVHAFQVQTYAVTESYVGASTLPSFPEPTIIPQGFTSRLETCVAGCGSGEVAATMTYPVGGSPYLSSPATVPNQGQSIASNEGDGGMRIESESTTQSSSPEEDDGRGVGTTDAGGLEAPGTSEESQQIVTTGDAHPLNAPMFSLVLVMGLALSLEMGH
ncbi:hypothetical protein GGR57DRAFT_516448 [Xylariaceae sp. FL1272]|nr:hypothetical protein GGR57DRAFT_516448 [Xylariaceae sp. FL1272]